MNDLVQALGVGSVHDVIAAAGPGRFVEPCRGGCGVVVERVVTSRAAAQSGGLRRAPWTDPRICPHCQARLAAEYEDRQREWRAARDREVQQERAEYDRAIADGARVVRRYVEYEGLGGTYADPEFESPTPRFPR